MKQRVALTFPLVLFVCFFLGTAAGTVIANCLGAELLTYIRMQAESSVFLSGTAAERLRGAGGSGRARLSAGQRRRLWRTAACQRFAEYGLAVLIGYTPFAAAAFSAGAFAAGAVFGLTVSVMTLALGLMGLPHFLAAVIPQWLFYLPAWILLAVNAEDGLAAMRRGTWLAVLLLAGIGTFLEAYVNPYLLGL